MSVSVTIDIAAGSAFRELRITNLTEEIHFDAHGHRVLDQVCEYEVIRWNSHLGAGEYHATFTHRFGDDVTILISKAGAALREKYGHV